MKYERLTKETVGSFGYDLKDFEHKPKEFNDYDAFYAYKMAVKRLGELEDKIESGEIDYVADRDKEIARLTSENASLRARLEKAVELPRIIHPNTFEWHIQYQYKSGIIDSKIKFSIEAAEACLKELKEKNND